MEPKKLVLRPKKALQDTALTRPDRTKSEERSVDVFWLDKNENMDPLYTAQLTQLLIDLPAAVLFGYPDCYQLYKKLADFLQVSINELFLAAGSDGVIRAIHEAFVEPGDVVIYPEPTFAMYPVYAKIYGAKAVLLDYLPSDHGPILAADSVLKAIKNNKPRLLCLPNPNSPTGTVFSEADLRNIIEAAGNVGAVILIDEAYYPFYPKTTVSWLSEYPHLVIARTFSKAWGLAGIRLGYAIANQPLAQILHKSRPMYEAGALSIIIAEKALSYPDNMLASVKRLNAGKEYFLAEMQQLGFATFDGEGNFLQVAFGAEAEKIHRALAGKVLYRKTFPHPSLSQYSRFTATTKEQFVPIVQLIKQAVRR